MVVGNNRREWAQMGATIIMYFLTLYPSKPRTEGDY